MLRYRHAFTLLELAVVLVIVSMMTGFGLQVYQTAGGQDCYAQTEGQLKTINRALDDYASRNSRLPKPSFPTLGSNDPAFGKEATGTQTDPTQTNYGTNDANGIPAGMSNNSGVLIGSLPHSDLNLSVDYAADCWGNKFTYAVTNALTSKHASNYPSAATLGAITLNGGTISGAAGMMSDKIDYVVISHGMNKFGATPMSANNRTQNNCNGTAGTMIDKENCDTSNAVFFNAVRNLGSGAADYFDDIVVFGKKNASSGGNNLYCWGSDYTSAGILADNNTSSSHYSYIPLKSQSTTEFSKFAEAIPNGQSHSYTGCALTCDGTPYCWGDNTYGSLGDNSIIKKGVPTAASTAVKFWKLYITGMDATVCGLRRNADGSNEGTAYCWGRNTSSGRAGVNSTANNILVPTAVNTAQKFKQLVAKDDTICGLTFNSDVYCWGGDHMDLGNANTSVTDNLTSPALVQGGRKFSSLRGGDILCGITNGLDPLGAGKVYCWGSDTAELGMFFSEPFTISAITQANPAVITTTLPHGLKLRDQFVVRRTTGMGSIVNKGTRTSGTTITANSDQSNVTREAYNVANATGLTANNVRPSTALGSTFTGYNSSALPAYTGGGELIITGAGSPRLMPGQGSLIFTSFAQTNDPQATYSAVAVVSNTGRMYSWGNRWNPLSFASLGDGATQANEPYILSISQANPAIATTSAAHGLAPGDRINMYGSSLSQIPMGFYIVGSTPTATTFSLQDSNAVPVNSSGFPAGGNYYYNKIPASGCFSVEHRLWPCSYTPVEVSGGHTVADGSKFVFGNYNTRSFINSAGAAKSWGNYNTGDNTSTTRNTPVDIRTSGNATLPVPFTRIFGFGDTICGINANSDAYCWGANGTGARGNNTTNDRFYVTPISAPVGGPVKWIDLQRIGNPSVACGLTPEATACPAPTACNDETIYWGNGCAAQTGAQAEGAAPTINNQATGRTGSARATCTNGSYVVDNTSCAATGCTAQTISWGAGCSKSMPAMNSGDNGSASNDAAGYTGTTNYTCNSGSINLSSSVCNLNCTGQTVNWGSCAGPASAAAHLAPSALVSNTNSGYSGNVTVQCNNGSFTQSSPSCAPVAADCSSQSVSWGSGCSATAPSILHSNNTGVSNSAPGRVGTATASCNNGTTTASGTCNLHCTARSETWGGNCAGSTPAINHSDNSTVTNTNSGYTGSVSMSCSNGTLSQSSPACSVVAPTCTGGSTYGQYVDSMSCTVETDATETCCTSPDKVIYRNRTQNVGSCGSMSWTTVSCAPCKGNGQPTWGNPGNCCNGDSDGDGTCGAPTSCEPVVSRCDTGPWMAYENSCNARGGWVRVLNPGGRFGVPSCAGGTEAQYDGECCGVPGTACAVTANWQAIAGGTTLAHGASRSGFTRSSIPYTDCTACAEYRATISCNNGTMSHTPPSRTPPAYNTSTTMYSSCGYTAPGVACY